MPSIKITTQAELDALPTSFPEFTCIDIVSPPTTGINVSKSYGSATVRASDSATVRAYGSATVTAYGSATVRAYGSATVTAYGSATVTASDSAMVRASDSATVRAYDSATVRAYGSATVTAYGSATVRASDSAMVRASDSATVTASDSATVTAYGSAMVRAYGSATVTAYGSGVVLSVFGFAVGVLFAKARIAKRGKNAIVVRQKPRPAKNISEWVEFNQTAAPRRGKAVVFKRVSFAFKTKEGTPNETLWTPGSVLGHPAWAPTYGECGAGKYHACALPVFCDEFRSGAKDKYVAIEVKVEDTFLWPKATYNHKIAFRKGRVLYECDAEGRKLP